MKKWAIIGAIFFAIAVGIGFFFDFNGDTLVQVALGAFGLTSIIVGAVKGQKEKGKFGWYTIVCIILAAVSGCIMCVAGVEKNIFSLIAGAVIGLLSIIVGIATMKYAERKSEKK